MPLHINHYKYIVHAPDHIWSPRSKVRVIWGLRKVHFIENPTVRTAFNVPHVALYCDTNVQLGILTHICLYQIPFGHKGQRSNIKIIKVTYIAYRPSIFIVQTLFWAACSYITQAKNVSSGLVTYIDLYQMLIDTKGQRSNTKVMKDMDITQRPPIFTVGIPSRVSCSYTTQAKNVLLGVLTYTDLYQMEFDAKGQRSNAKVTHITIYFIYPFLSSLLRHHSSYDCLVRCRNLHWSILNVTWL